MNIKNMFLRFERLISEKNFQKANEILKNIDSQEQKFLDNHPHRKKSGIFYTTYSLSEFIFQNTLTIYLNHTINLNLRNLNEIFNLKRQCKINIRNVLENITICDPTCGSGNFLISAARVLYSLIEKFEQETDTLMLKTDILQNLFGFDINQASLTLSKLKLIKWFHDDGFNNYYQIRSILDSNLKLKNSLINSDLSKFNLERDTFDIIIGNPPYGNILSDKEKKILKEQNIYSNDIYCAYLLKILEICGGIIGLLIPKSFLLRQSYIKFRNKLLSESNFSRIYDLGSNIFKSATNEVQILIYGKKDENKCDLEVFDFPDKKIISYQNQSFDKLNICFNDTCPLINRSKKYYVYTQKEKCPFCSNRTTSLNRIRIKPNKEILDLINSIENKGNLNYLNIIDFPKLIRGEEAKGLSLVRKAIKKTNGSCYFLDAKRDFDYFYFKKSASFNLNEIDETQLKGNEKEYYKGPKLLIKHNNIYPEALYTQNNVCFTSSIYSLLSDDSTELKYLCGMLNSLLIHFYTIYGINNQKNTTINLNQYMIRHLPIKKIDQKQKNNISKLIDLISNDFETEKGLNDKIITNIKELNNIIFELFSLNNNDRNLMINKVKLFNPFFNNIY